MVPTERALGLGNAVRTALAELERVLAPDERHRRADLAGQVVLELDDFVRLLLLPELVARIGREVPAVSLEVLSARSGRDSVSSSTMSRENEIDIRVSVRSMKPDRRRRQERLFADDWVCLVRKGLAGSHFRLEGELFGVLNHVVITDGDRDLELEDALVRAGLVRRVVLKVPELMTAASVTSQSDCVAMVPRRLARRLEQDLSLDVLDPPIKTPSIVYFASWPRSVERSEAAMWVKQTLVDISRELDRAAGAE
jgi:DNA-binding transcriptional LysR family regulator